MKRILCVVLLLLLALSAIDARAHPGSTDGNGGHHNRSTGEYHYHHGKPEHQHIDGVCPYDYEDTTNHTTSKIQKDIDPAGMTFSEYTMAKYGDRFSEEEEEEKTKTTEDDFPWTFACVGSSVATIFTYCKNDKAISKGQYLKSGSFTVWTIPFYISLICLYICLFFAA